MHILYPRTKLTPAIPRSPEFPTSRLEMGTVADIFDRNQDGYIDYQEFIAALRPDWERKGPLTDAERIDDEVQKQVSKCTCRQKFRVHQVGEGKYRVRRERCRVEGRAGGLTEVLMKVSNKCGKIEVIVLRACKVKDYKKLSFLLIQ